MIKIYYSTHDVNILSISDKTDNVEFISQKTLQGFECINQFCGYDLNKFIEDNSDKKICFYGAGKHGKEILKNIKKTKNLICTFDRDPHKKVCEGFEVKSPTEIEVINPDIIIIVNLYPYEILNFLSNLKSNKNLGFEFYTYNNLPTKKWELSSSVIKKWADLKNPFCNPSSSVLANSRHIEAKEFKKDFEFELLEEVLEKEYSHLFLINSLLVGGSEKVCINYLKALNEINPDKKVLLITTMDNPPIWLDKLPSNVNLLSFGSLYKSISYEKQLELLYLIIMNCKADKLHILNSCLGYDVLDKYGYKIAKNKKIFDSQWCINVSQEGYYCDYPIKHINPDILTAMFSENKNYYTQLTQFLDFPKDKYKVHYQPVEIKESKPKGIKISGKLNILWASRICQQKRPDILLKIAECCKYMPVHFHIWGRIPENYDISNFEQENITYHGEFTEFDFSNEDYDLFLYTAETDGCPNIIIEAAQAKIPILTSNSGGVNEIVNRCALIVEDFDDIFDYASCIYRITNGISIGPTLTPFCYSNVKEQHSWEKFIENVRGEKEYV